MKVVVVGGTGRLGSQVVAEIQGRGHEAVAAAPSTGFDTLTGAGVLEGVQGAQAVIDVSNAPSFEAAEVLRFFQTSTGTLGSVCGSRLGGFGQSISSRGRLCSARPVEVAAGSRVRERRPEEEVPGRRWNRACVACRCRRQREWSLSSCPPERTEAILRRSYVSATLTP